MRKILSLAFAVALGLSVIGFAGSDADAKGKNKKCIGTDLAGKQVTFKCAAEEKCCFSALTKKGTCVKAPNICL